MKFSQYAFILIAFSIIINVVDCWWDGGHLIVAKIAENKLKIDNPKAVSLFKKLSLLLKPVSHRKVSTFIETAIWPDLVKKYKLNHMDNWHFVDLPVNYTNLEPPVLDPSIQDDSVETLVKNPFNIGFCT